MPLFKTSPKDGGLCGLVCLVAVTLSSAAPDRSRAPCANAHMPVSFLTPCHPKTFSLSGELASGPIVLLSSAGL